MIIIYKNIYAIEIKSHDGRGVQTINSELSIGGAKESFCENINTNLSLITFLVSCLFQFFSFCYL